MIDVSQVFFIRGVCLKIVIKIIVSTKCGNWKKYADWLTIK